MRCGSRVSAVTLFVFMLATVAPAIADTPAPARPYEVGSANGHWRARIDPADPLTAARVAVRRTSADHHTWSVPLTNATAPETAYVTNDGQRVVTLDTVGSLGFGDDVVAIYGPKGQLQRYPLESVLGVSNGATTFEHPDVRPRPDGRAWRSGAEVLLQGDGEPAIFGVWLPATHVWIVWDLATGEKLPDDPELLARLNDTLRSRAIARLALAAHEPWDPGQSSRYWPLETLAYQRRPRDRPHLERALASPAFGSGELTVFRDGREHKWHFGESPLRREADRLLAEWDHKPIAIDSYGEPIGARLGAVRGEVRLSKSPRGDGVIHVVLLPVDGALKVGSPLPPQRVNIDLTQGRPESKDVRFRIGTVTPGSYRVIAIWGGRPTNSDFVLYEPAKGEWLSAGPIIHVRAGGLTEVLPFGAGRTATNTP